MSNSWLNDQVEICHHLNELRQKCAPRFSLDAPLVPTQILSALRQFQECVRYLNTRHSAGAILQLDSEEAAQDALYLMLRPWVHDLVPESPTEKVGNRYTIRDFVSKQARTILEAKFIRNKDHGKCISKELNDDIETYRHHVHCDTLIFFIYDPSLLIPDRQQLINAVETERVYAGRKLECKLVVMP